MKQIFRLVFFIFSFQLLIVSPVTAQSDAQKRIFR